MLWHFVGALITTTNKVDIIHDIIHYKFITYDRLEDARTHFNIKGHVSIGFINLEECSDADAEFLKSVQ